VGGISDSTTNSVHLVRVFYATGVAEREIDKKKWKPGPVLGWGRKLRLATNSVPESAGPVPLVSLWKLAFLINPIGASEIIVLAAWTPPTCSFAFFYLSDRGFKN